MTKWTDAHRNELAYHVKRINRVQSDYGFGVRDPQAACQVLERTFADYDGDAVVKVVKELIRVKSRIPLESEIWEVLDVKDKPDNQDCGDVLQGNQVVCPQCGIAQ